MARDRGRAGAAAARGASASSWPGRGTTFARDHRRPAGRAHRRAPARLDRQRRAQLVHRLRPAVAALPRDRPRPAGPRPRHPVAAALPPGRLRRRRRRAARAPRRRARRSSSATRWAGRSRSCCGAATRSGWRVSCSAPRPTGSCRGARERLIFGTMMATAVGTTRTGRAASAGRPTASMRRWAPRVHAARPTSLRAWAAGEMRRHDAVKLMEAGQAIGSYNARRWIGEIDVPTTVLVTERDRAIAPREQLKHGRRHPGAVVQPLDDGHVACAKREFGPALVRAVDSVHGADRSACARADAPTRVGPLARCARPRGGRHRPGPVLRHGARRPRRRRDPRSIARPPAATRRAPATTSWRGAAGRSPSTSRRPAAPEVVLRLVERRRRAARGVPPGRGRAARHRARRLPRRGTRGSSTGA